MNIVDSVVIVMKALLMGLEVNIGDRIFVYNNETDSVVIKGADSKENVVYLNTVGLTLNGFIKMVHDKLTEEERIKLVGSMAIMKNTRR